MAAMTAERIALFCVLVRVTLAIRNSKSDVFLSGSTSACASWHERVDSAVAVAVGDLPRR